MFPRAIPTLAATPFLGAVAVTVAIVASGRHRRLGATRTEAALDLPGDDLLERADVQADRAITIAAAPERVWPWIAQLGQDKGGFYSFEWAENLVGCNIHNANQIVPAWQRPQVGDPFPLHPEMVLRVGVVEPGRALVATSQGGSGPADSGMDFTWAFVISALPPTPGTPLSTRLHIRERYRASTPTVRVGVEMMNLVSTVMSWRMTRTIRRLAESP